MAGTDRLWSVAEIVLRTIPKKRRRDDFLRLNPLFPLWRTFCVFAVHPRGFYAGVNYGLHSLTALNLTVVSHARRGLARFGDELVKTPSGVLQVVDVPDVNIL